MSHSEYDQKDDETDAEYSLFQQFLALGPSRTLQAFINMRAAQRPMGMSKRVKKGHASTGTNKTSRLRNGYISDLCATRRWLERAALYDVDNLRHVLPSLAASVYECLRLFVSNYYDALLHQKAKPLTWNDFIVGIQTIGSFIPAEAFALIMNGLEDREEKALSDIRKSEGK